MMKYIALLSLLVVGCIQASQEPRYEGFPYNTVIKSLEVSRGILIKRQNGVEVLKLELEKAIENKDYETAEQKLSLAEKEVKYIRDSGESINIVITCIANSHKIDLDRLRVCLVREKHRAAVRQREQRKIK